MAIGGIVGGGLGGVGYLISSDKRNDATNEAERLTRKKGELFRRSTENALTRAQRNLRQGLADNILIQANSGIELNSGTFNALNESFYNSYVEDREEIELQGQLQQLGIQSEINSINNSRQSGIERFLSFTDASLSGYLAGEQFQSAFSKPKSSPNLSKYNTSAYNFNNPKYKNSISSISGLPY